MANLKKPTLADVRAAFLRANTDIHPSLIKVRWKRKPVRSSHGLGPSWGASVIITAHLHDPVVAQVIRDRDGTMIRILGIEKGMEESCE